MQLLFTDDHGGWYLSRDGGRTGAVMRSGWVRRWTLVEHALVLVPTLLLAPVVPLMLAAREIAALYMGGLCIVLFLTPTALVRMAFQPGALPERLRLVQPRVGMHMLNSLRVWALFPAAVAAKFLLMDMPAPAPDIGQWPIPLAIAAGLCRTVWQMTQAYEQSATEGQA